MEARLPNRAGAEPLLCLRQLAVAASFPLPASPAAQSGETDVQRDTGVRMVANQRNNKDEEHQTHGSRGDATRYLNFSAFASSGDRRRRKAICDSRIMIHTQTVAKVASDAITRKTFSGMM